MGAGRRDQWPAGAHGQGHGKKTWYALQPFSQKSHTPTVAREFQIGLYSRSPKNPALQQLQKSAKSTSTTPQRAIWNYFATVGVRDFWANGCTTPQRPIWNTVGTVAVRDFSENCCTGGASIDGSFGFSKIRTAMVVTRSYLKRHMENIISISSICFFDESDTTTHTPLV